MQYTGEKIRLRAYRREDIPMAQAFLNDPEVRRLLAPGIPYPYTLENEYAWYDQLSALKDAYDFAIETLEGSRYIGGCGIANVDWKNRLAEVGIFIGDHGFWGKGYGTDALRVLMRFAFEEMNLNKIKLNVYDFNTRAIRSYRKCGFVLEGTLREALFREGVYHDTLCMGILKREYDAL